MNTAAKESPLALHPEGHNGLFSQTWLPVCLSRDVPRGTVIGRGFLDGRIAIFRGEDGIARVVSAYCAHVGADLSCGDVTRNELRCAFHHWRYDGQGRCIATGIGDPPPPAARLFRFPVCERWGIVFVFNGTEPTWSLPEFPFPDDELVLLTEPLPELPCDPWVVCANTPDIQHIKVLHGVRIEEDDDAIDVKWTDHSMLYRVHGTHQQGQPLALEVGIYGTSLFSQFGEIAGRWLGVMAPMGIPRPGCTQLYFVIAAHKGKGTELEESAALAHTRFGLELERKVVAEDYSILRRIHYRQGALTRSDRILGRFLDYVRRFPRVHPSAAHIR
jgi:phenylpropionate dioxygenase-like ring-hydroxylating dioxygenase large terminal subunit